MKYFPGTGKRGTVDGDFFREEYDMNYVLSKSLVFSLLSSFRNWSLTTIQTLKIVGYLSCFIRSPR